MQRLKLPGVRAAVGPKGAVKDLSSRVLCKAFRSNKEVENEMELGGTREGSLDKGASSWLLPLCLSPVPSMTNADVFDLCLQIMTGWF